MYWWMSLLSTDWIACATCGKRRNSAQLEASSRLHSPPVVRSVHTLQIRFRTMASNSSNERSILKSPFQTVVTARRSPSPTHRYLTRMVLRQVDGLHCDCERD